MRATTHKWDLVVEPLAQKEVDGLSSRNRQHLFDTLQKLLRADNPLRVPGVEKYQAECGTWKIRQGDYRIMFCLATGCSAEISLTACKGRFVLKRVALHHTAYKKG